ncbi:DNA internalization-related competence protein ComEC/Rec2 [Kingella negevensis]|uniref:DNA internalization-related competence protein ComEC/Rec2 n=1 Tax=Kingella negevensis TaxID=1522312 RepID=UPI00254D9B83|nr:DNA internalization-related competence protein ComEC/Rec2 [Kingella negevensis]MDK4697514.1 DNA internalization-related competence protein ComEC/Rec2 [Kingella negevensis]
MNTTYLFTTFALGAIASFFLPTQGNFWFWLIAFTANLAAIIWAKHTRSLKIFQAAFLCFCALLGASYAIGRTQWALSQQWQPTLSPVPTPLRVQITELPKQDETNADHTSFIGTAQTADGKTYRLYFNDYAGGAWHVGETWQLNARVRATVGTRNFVGFDREAWALSNQIDGIANISKNNRLLQPENVQNINSVRAKIIAGWQDAAAHYPQGAGLMTALAVADPSGLSHETWAALRPLGLNHLVSISGLHIGMVSMLATGLALVVLYLSRLEIARPRVWALSFGVLVGLFYTALAGFQVPALRSFLMFSVFAVAWIGRKKAKPWRTWWAALAVVLLFQPAAVLATGFWLSFGLVGVLIWACGFRLRPFPRGWAFKLKQAVFAQGALTLASAVMTVFLFGSLPIFSPLVNAVAIPFFSWLLVPLALVASVLPFGSLKMWVAWLGEWTVSVLQFLGGVLPEWYFVHAPTGLMWAAMAGVLLLVLPRGSGLKPLACCGLAAFFLYRVEPVSHGFKMTVFDVGQGLSVLLQTPSQNVLFDTGKPAVGATLLQNLRAKGVWRLDSLIVSHHDNDHDGGFAEINRSLKVDEIWAGQPEFYPQAKYCADGLAWTVDDVRFEFLTPPMGFQAADNDLSCVLRVVSGAQSLLIMGDTGKAGEWKLLQKYGTGLKSDVLVLGHHGSKSATSSVFLDAVAPQIAIASSGFANAFRHPHPNVQAQLAARSVGLYRTDLQGGVQVDFDGSRFQAALATEQKFWWQRKPFLRVPE